MLDKYEILRLITLAVRNAGAFMVWMLLLGACIMMWYFVFTILEII